MATTDFLPELHTIYKKQRDFVENIPYLSSVGIGQLNALADITLALGDVVPMNSYQRVQYLSYFMNAKAEELVEFSKLPRKSEVAMGYSAVMGAFIALISLWLEEESKKWLMN